MPLLPYRHLNFVVVLSWILSGLLAEPGLAEPVPSSSLDVPTAIKIGEPFTFNVAFDNTAVDPKDAGYGPFLDLIFPVNGVDGAAGADIADGTMT